MVVDLFVPCYMDQFHPETAFNAIKLLEACGVTVNYQPEQTCCGKMSFETGYWDDAKVLGDRFVDIFKGSNCIIGLSTSCVSYVQSQCKSLYTNTGYHNEFQKIASNIFTIEDFLVNTLNRTDFGATYSHKAMYHDSCSALNTYRKDLYNEPRILLENVKNLELVKTEGISDCNGYGDLFSVKFNGISDALIEDSITPMLSTGIDTIIVSDCGCMMNINAYIKKNNLPLSVVHIIDVLSSF